MLFVVRIPPVSEQEQQDQKKETARQAAKPQVGEPQKTQIIVRTTTTTQKGPGTDDEQLEELCRFFGALSQRDTERTVVRVFRVVVQRTGPDKGIGSSELANEEHLNRLTALHHLNRLAELGLLDKRDGRYFMKDFDGLFAQMEQEMLESIRRAREIARRMENDL